MEFVADSQVFSFHCFELYFFKIGFNLEVNHLLLLAFQSATQMDDMGFTALTNDIPLARFFFVSAIVAKLARKLCKLDLWKFLLLIFLLNWQILLVQHNIQSFNSCEVFFAHRASCFTFLAPLSQTFDMKRMLAIVWCASQIPVDWLNKADRALITFSF